MTYLAMVKLTVKMLRVLLNVLSLLVKALLILAIIVGDDHSLHFPPGLPGFMRNIIS